MRGAWRTVGRDEDEGARQRMLEKHVQERAGKKDVLVQADPRDADDDGMLEHLLVLAFWGVISDDRNGNAKSGAHGHTYMPLLKRAILAAAAAS